VIKEIRSTNIISWKIKINDVVILYHSEDKCLTSPTRLLLSTQNLVVDIQFEAQIGNGFFVGSLVSEPFGE
jgi:hypothetical protein